MVSYSSWNHSVLPITGRKPSSWPCAAQLAGVTGRELGGDNDAFVWRRTASGEKEKAEEKAGNQ